MALVGLALKAWRGLTADRPTAATAHNGRLPFFVDESASTHTLYLCRKVAGVPTWEQILVGTEGVSSAMLTTRGDLLVRGASAPERLGLGASGYVLTSNGTDATWAAPLSATLTTRGDLFVRGAATVGRLALGTSGQVLTSNGTDAAWSTPATAAARALVGPFCQDNVANGQTATPATLGAAGASVATYVPARAGSITAISLFCVGGFSGDFSSTHGAAASITASVRINGTAIAETCALAYPGGSAPAIPGRVSVTIAAGLRTYSAGDAITVTIASDGSLVLSDDIQVWVETTES